MIRAPYQQHPNDRRSFQSGIQALLHFKTNVGQVGIGQAVFVTLKFVKLDIEGVKHDGFEFAQA